MINKSVVRETLTSPTTLMLEILKGSTSMTIYLYKKTHNITGLKYLGKTTAKNPHKYKGSGHYWKSHINIHGYNVTTEILKECSTIEELQQWGRYYSELWDVVNSKEWANLKPEEGDGNSGEKWREIFSRPGVIERRSTTFKNNYYSDPTNHKIWSERSKSAMADPDTKSKHKKSMSSAMNKESTKEKCGYSQKLAWKDPVERQKRINAQIEAQNRPEMKAMRSGKNNPRYDHTLYNFEHKDGTKECCTRNELCEKYNLSKERLRWLVKGEIQTYKGWKLRAAS